MRFLLRCDASTEIGTGHVFRCLALALSLTADSHQAVFCSAQLHQSLLSRLIGENLKVHEIRAAAGSQDDAKETAAFAQGEKCDWIITDGYVFQTKYQQFFKEQGFNLMCIDDIAGCDYVADIVVNQNPGFTKGDYKTTKDCQLLLGPQYVLLRPEFLEAGQAKQDFGQQTSTILLSMGGADKDDFTRTVLADLAKLENVKINVLVGSAYQHLGQLQINQPSNVEIFINVTNVVPLMQSCDLAIHAAGTISWELAYLGVPSLSFAIANNQLPVGRGLEQAGYSRFLGRQADYPSVKLTDFVKELLAKPARLCTMSRAGQKLIDGQGGQRIKQAVFSFHSK